LLKYVKIIGTYVIIAIKLYYYYYYNMPLPLNFGCWPVDPNGCYRDFKNVPVSCPYMLIYTLILNIACKIGVANIQIFWYLQHYIFKMHLIKKNSIQW